MRSPSISRVFRYGGVQSHGGISPVGSVLIQEIFGNAGVGPHALQVTRHLKHDNAIVPGGRFKPWLPGNGRSSMRGIMGYTHI